MSITAIYENGVFKPLEPVNFADSTRVEIEVSAVESPPSSPDQKPTGRWGLKLGLIGELPPDFKDIPAEFDSIV